MITEFKQMPLSLTIRETAEVEKKRIISTINRSTGLPLLII